MAPFGLLQPGEVNAEQEIRRRIQESGQITFAEFMDLALYWPGGGYYTGRSAVGAHRDYYTSPAAHPAFGALLALQLYQMWREMDRPRRFTVVELGAGNGLLCRDILSYVPKLPRASGKDFSASLDYLCIDCRATPGLESGLSSAGRVSAANFPLKGITGCVLSNEYLDAFPVHQVVLVQGSLQEVYVTVQDGKLTERRDEPSTPDLAARLESVGVNLQDGQTAEICLRLDRWPYEVAAGLDRGFVLTIDYGRVAQDLYSPEKRLRGTLTTYRNHLQTDAPLERIGEQDITSQVDFTTLARFGEAAGLSTLGLTTQREFLRNLGLTEFQNRLRGGEKDGEGPAMSGRGVQAGLAGMLDLVKPGGLGDFKVLIQGKNVGQPQLWGLEPSPGAQELATRLPVPALSEEHLPLLTGRYPEYEVNLESFWPTDEETPPAN